MKCKNCIHYDPVHPLQFISKRDIVIVEFVKACNEHGCAVYPDEPACKSFWRK